MDEVGTKGGRGERAKFGKNMEGILEGERGEGGEKNRDHQREKGKRKGKGEEKKRTERVKENIVRGKIESCGFFFSFLSFLSFCFCLCLFVFVWFFLGGVLFLTP